MRRYHGQPIGMTQGSRVLFSDFADDGPMWTGNGPRESRHAVVFDHPFAEPPLVMVSISMWDLDRKSNTRADIAAERIAPTGFDLVFRTWGDTRVARIRADWIAMGALADDDAWQLY